MRKLLDLFCGAGGCTKGYQEAGFYVVGVDINPQKNYIGEEFIQADVMTWLEEAITSRYTDQFDVIHASPPCQRYSTLGSMHNVDPSSHPDYIGGLRGLLGRVGSPYIIENVPGSPLVDPIRLCGSMFGIRVRKHRLFECKPSIPELSCMHGWQDDNPIYDIYEKGKWRKSGVAYVFGHGGGKASEHWAKAMGINWMTRNELAQAIPPAYTKYIGERMLELI